MEGYPVFHKVVSHALDDVRRESRLDRIKDTQHPWLLPRLARMRRLGVCLAPHEELIFHKTGVAAAHARNRDYRKLLK